MEVDAALGLDVDMVEGEVHQHRLAAPDPAPQIDAGRAVAALAEQPREEAAARSQVGGEPVERRDRACLRRIGLQFARRDQRGVGRADRSGHRLGAFGRCTRFSVPVKL